ncbi:MAG TPA: hypothetical protein VFO48_12395 [Vicinamibacterales bacterium]|nr:hypothetical protein [Vicinamibacterales bacterium]
MRLVRRAGLVDRTVLKNPNVKLNWQFNKRSMVSCLFFDGCKVKHGSLSVRALASTFGTTR